MLTDCRHRIGAASLTGHRCRRGITARHACFAEKCVKRHVRPILEVRTCPDFPFGSADQQDLPSEAILSRRLVDHEVSTFPLLIGKSSFSQAKPNCILGNGRTIEVADNVLNLRDRPQIGLVTNRRGGPRDDTIRFTFIELLQLTRPATISPSRKSAFPNPFKTLDPAIQCRSLISIGIRNVRQRHPSRRDCRRVKTNVVLRVSRFIHNERFIFMFSVAGPAPCCRLSATGLRCRLGIVLNLVIRPLN